MATITPRGKYQWQVRIRRKGFPEQIKTCDTKAQAEAWARDVESKMDHGIFIDRSPLEKMTLGQLLDQYKKQITPAKKGASKEDSKIGVISKSKLAKMTLAYIEPSDIADYRDERLKKVSPGTVIKELNLISNAYNIAASEWHMRGLDNPVERVRRPRPPKGRERRLASLQELEGLIQATESKTLKALIPFAVETAMRRGEMVKLIGGDVDLKKQIATLVDTKNGETRIVPLSTRAVTLLAEIIGKKEDRLFKIQPNTATQAFSRAVKRARKGYEAECKVLGVEPESDMYTNLRLHDMRHEATSRFFEKGLATMEVSHITGHKDLRMLKRYTHLNAEEIAKKLG